MPACPLPPPLRTFRRLPAPSTLAALTRLTLLSLSSFMNDATGHAISDSIEATLAALPQLQHLRCSDANSASMPQLARPPSALASLHSLRRFWWDVGVDDASLPGGAWLHGLRALGLPADAIVANQDRLLAATPHLESLHVLTTNDEPIRASLRVAVRHPTLRRLHTRMPWDKPASITASIDWAMEQRPDVFFACSTSPPYQIGDAFDGEPES